MCVRLRTDNFRTKWPSTWIFDTIVYLGAVQCESKMFTVKMSDSYRKKGICQLCVQCTYYMRRDKGSFSWKADGNPHYVTGSYFLYVFFSILSPWVPSLFASESSVVLSGHRNSWKIALMWLKAATPIYKLLLSSKSWLNEVNLHFKIRPREDDMDSLAGSLWRQVGNRKSCVLCTLKSTSQLLKLWIVIWT